MDEKEFRKQAKEYGYDEKQIQEFIDLVNEANNDGVSMKFETIVLVEQPVY